jgi:Flp pilus assembly protein TadD
LIALVAAALALVVQFIRWRAEQPDYLFRHPEQLVADALRRVESDPSFIRHMTQTRLRAAATLADAGTVRSAEASYLLALQYRREQNFSASEAWFRRSMEQKPAWSRPYGGLGALLHRYMTGREAESEAMLRKAIELAPDWYQPLDHLAVLLRKVGKREEAESLWRKAIELAPEAVAPRNNYANLLVDRKRYAEAEEQYLAAIKLEPDHPKPYYNLACLYSLMDRPAEALDKLRAALQRAEALRSEAATDPDFDAIRTLPEFRKLVYGIGA